MLAREKSLAGAGLAGYGRFSLGQADPPGKLEFGAANDNSLRLAEEYAAG